MLTAPEVPRTRHGGLALCHFCQRRIYFVGGFLPLLAQDLEWAAKDATFRKAQRGRS